VRRRTYAGVRMLGELVKDARRFDVVVAHLSLLRTHTDRSN
jgi:hypothetical protein